jgi:hypothetical protein
MRGFHNSSFDPQTLVLLEVAFDEARLTLKSVGNNTVKPDELARAVLRLAMEGERDPVRLHDGCWTDCYPLPPGARRIDRGVTQLASATPPHSLVSCKAFLAGKARS